jgi:hypothetical protein
MEERGMFFQIQAGAIRQDIDAAFGIWAGSN